MTELELFKAQINILEKAAIMLNDRKRKMEHTARSNQYNSKYDSEMESAIQIFLIRSLTFYNDIISYIILSYSILLEEDEIDDKMYFFMLPNIRTLLDIYAKFMHLLEECKNKKEQALVCIACQLLLSKYLNSEEEYKDIRSLYDSFLENTKPQIPLKIFEFSKKWVKNNNLRFAEIPKLLTTNNIKKYSLNVRDVFGSDEMHNIYGTLSEYLHGNPFYYIEDSHNEKFWVISYSVIITAYFIELIDLHFLNKRNTKDLTDWIKLVKKEKPSFTNLWRMRQIGK